MKHNLVFIASGGRTGSMFLGKYLSQVIEDCYSEHEPDLYAGFSKLTFSRIKHFGFKHMILDRCLGRSGVRVLGQKLMKGEITDSECFLRLREIRARYHSQISQGLIIESYYSWWLFANNINRIWPHAKMAGIIRDPRTWIDSWKAHCPARRNNSSHGGFIQPLLTPESINDTQWSPHWRNIGQKGRLAWDWRNVYRELVNAQNDSSHVRIFKFEDLFGSESQSLDSFIQFTTDHCNRHYRVLDLEIMKRMPVNSSANTENLWQTWTAEEARVVDQMCGSIMKLFGYGTEPEWQRLLSS